MDKNKGMETSNTSLFMMIITGVFFDKNSPKSKTLIIVNSILIMLFAGVFYFLYKMASA